MNIPHRTQVDLHLEVQPGEDATKRVQQDGATWELSIENTRGTRKDLIVRCLNSRKSKNLKVTISSWSSTQTVLLPNGARTPSRRKIGENIFAGRKRVRKQNFTMRVNVSSDDHWANNGSTMFILQVTDPYSPVPTAPKSFPSSWKTYAERTEETDFVFTFDEDDKSLFLNRNFLTQHSKYFREQLQLPGNDAESWNVRSICSDAMVLLLNLVEHPDQLNDRVVLRAKQTAHLFSFMEFEAACDAYIDSHKEENPALEHVQNDFPRAGLHVEEPQPL